MGPVHLAHSTGADRLFDLVMPERFADHFGALPVPGTLRRILAWILPPMRVSAPWVDATF